MAALLGPAFPEVLTGLWEIFERLDMMRGAGFNGPERLTPWQIKAAAELFGWTLQPHEVEALIVLDAVTLYPGDEE